MGMLSRAMKSRKKQMQEELEAESELQQRSDAAIVKVVSMPDDMAKMLYEMSTMRGIAVEQLVITHMTSVCNAYKNSKILSLHHEMPYGKYRGVMIEDMIRADPRYVNWMASTSNIFVLDEAATQLLKELS